MIWLSWSARLFPLRHLGDGANVFFSGAAAAADHVQPAAIGEALELLRQGFRRLAVQALFIGQPGVRIARNVAVGQGLQRAQMVGHEFRAGGAIQTQRNQVDVIE